MKQVVSRYFHHSWMLRIKTIKTFIYSDLVKTYSSSKTKDWTRKQRNGSFKFHVMAGDKKVSHAMSQKKVFRLASLLLNGETPNDKRGLDPNPKRMPETVKYFDGKLDVKQMHTLFQDKYPNTKVSYKYYLKYYNENFWYRFGRPQMAYDEKSTSHI
ncbi:hypothetical protein PR048_019605 [Dryococelus australis]|uniref:Uncharacterized protein n=1 Tax=Dryococelus australis TaxID=614101 RepID=A0ABQ9H3Y2_9NEOP|nr:hypothetical protein PR048_019605 [Dryococelus australis]